MGGFLRETKGKIEGSKQNTGKRKCFSTQGKGGKVSIGKLDQAASGGQPHFLVHP